jgi:LuxR family maltose regulon positive regulatory protein
LDVNIASIEPSKEDIRTLSFLRLFEHTTCVRIWIAQGQPEKALSGLQRLLHRAETGGWTIFIIEILILEAIALQIQGETRPAMATLRRALSLAEPGGFVRVFLDEGKLIADLMRCILDDEQGSPQTPETTPSRKYVKKLVLASQVSPPPRISTGLMERLSERELEVLQLIAAGLSNQEVAEKLFISLNTVRSHTKNINSKLDVHSRTQAIARAKELGWL